IRDFHVTGVQTCALPIYLENAAAQRHFVRVRMAADVSGCFVDGDVVVGMELARSDISRNAAADDGDLHSGTARGASSGQRCGTQIGRASCREREEGSAVV